MRVGEGDSLPALLRAGKGREEDCGSSMQGEAVLWRCWREWSCLAGGSGLGSEKNERLLEIGSCCCFMADAVVSPSLQTCLSRVLRTTSGLAGRLSGSSDDPPLLLG